MQKHIPVLQQEVLDYLNPSSGENFIDATLGYGGHSKLILEKTAPDGQILAIDQDEEAITEAKNNLMDFADRVHFAKANFIQLGLLVRNWKVGQINGILIDLGVNSPQLTGDRGFSFNIDAPLDMRMAPHAQRLTATSIVNKYSEKELLKILTEYGEERYAKPIVANILKNRGSKPIQTTIELVEIIKKSTPPSYRFGRRLHFATNTFRALRMAVNNEPEALKNVLPQAVKALSPGGRIAIISFQSIEDRLVKDYFRDNPELEILTKKPIGPTEEEIALNPAARSAKIRVAVKKS